MNFIIIVCFLTFWGPEFGEKISVVFRVFGSVRSGFVRLGLILERKFRSFFGPFSFDRFWGLSCFGFRTKNDPTEKPEKGLKTDRNCCMGF